MDNNQPEKDTVTTDTRPKQNRHQTGALTGTGASRRRLAQAGLAVPVIMSLSARPVWASNTGACSLSGDIFSANLSNIDHKCTEGWGCTPGFWKENIPPWATTDFDPGDCTALKNDNGSKGGKCEAFDSSTGTKFIDVFGVSPNCGGAITLMDVLQTCNGTNANLEFHAVGAVLNASSSYVDYGATVQQVVEAYLKANDPTVTLEIRETVKYVFQNMNERSCPLNAHGLCNDGYVNQDGQGYCIPVVTSVDKSKK